MVNRLVALTALLTPLVWTSSAEAGEPWYTRDTCKQAMHAVFRADFTAADKKLKAIEASRDLDDQACGVWARAVMAELELAVGGQLPALVENRKNRVKRMYGFARAKGKLAARFADLEIEARLRRIRVLIDDGKKNDALKEAKRARQLLDMRKDKGPSTPTQLYSEGVSNLAVGFAAWPVRMVLKLAGVPSDAELGAKSMFELYNGKTVYRPEATYVLRTFAEEEPEGILGPPLKYSKKLVGEYPDNPQLLYDLALDLRRDKQCKATLEALKPTTDKLGQNPSMWSKRVRSKLYWISGRCALDTGDRKLARHFAELAKADVTDEVSDRVDELWSDL